MNVTILAIPLVPVYWVLGALVGVFATKKFFFDKEKIKDVNNEVKKSKKIAVLGHQHAGKTTFLRFLKGDKNYKNINHETGIDEYEEFVLKAGGKLITISKNIDIGGSEDFVRKNYELILKNADMAFFLFDVSRFFKETDYFRDFCARVDFLKSITEIKVYFIATHSDKLESTESVKLKISEKLKDKDYNNYVEYGLFVINLIDEKQLSEFVNKSFQI